MTASLKANHGFFPTIFSAKWLAILLIGSQLVVKFFIEFTEASRLSTSLPIYQTVWVLTAGWLILLPLCIQDNRGAFLAGVLWGIVNAVGAVAAPLSGICDHWVIGSAVGIQCLLIAVTCYFTYKRAAPQASEQTR